MLQEYHDREWGVPQLDDRSQFEHIALETFQAGLSWLTVLKKRETLRGEFAGFNPQAVAGFTQLDTERILRNAEGIRSRAKITAVISNAARFLQISEEYGGFVNFLKQFTPPERAAPEIEADLPSQAPESAAGAKALKKLGFKFIGAVTLYAHLQATGLVNDHLADCPRRAQVELLRKRSNL